MAKAIRSGHPQTVTELNEQVFRDIYPDIAKFWKEFGLYLGLKWKDLDLFEIEPALSHEDKVFKMLVHWNRKNDDSDKLEKFNKVYTAIQTQNFQRVDIPWESGGIHDDKFLFQICKNIGSSRLFVLHQLQGIKPNDIEHAKSQYPNNDLYAAMEVFVQWRSSQKDANSSMYKLVKAIETNANSKFIAKLRKNVRANPKLIIELKEVTFLTDDKGDEIFLGKGTYGRVMKGRYMEKDVAIKVLFEGYRVPEHLKQLLIKEAETMQKVSNANSVPLQGIFIDDKTKRYGLIMEFMSNGSLSDFVESDTDEPLSWALKFRLLMDIARGMVYLHRNKLVHQDLKSSNVMIDDYFNARVGDFGNAEFIDQTMEFNKDSTSENKSKFHGTATHSAPEVLYNRTGNYTPQKESDAWSFGIIMFFVGAEKKRALDPSKYPFKRLPFSNRSTAKNIIALVGVDRQCPITEEQIIEKISDDCPSEYIAIMKHCVEVQITKRLSDFSEINKKLGKYFTKNNFEESAYEEVEIRRHKIYKERKASRNLSLSLEITTDDYDDVILPQHLARPVQTQNKSSLSEYEFIPEPRATSLETDHGAIQLPVRSLIFPGGAAAEHKPTPQPRSTIQPMVPNKRPQYGARISESSPHAIEVISPGETPEPLYEECLYSGANNYETIDESEIRPTNQVISDNYLHSSDLPLMATQLPKPNLPLIRNRNSAVKAKGTENAYESLLKQFKVHGHAVVTDGPILSQGQHFIIERGRWKNDLKVAVKRTASLASDQNVLILQNEYMALKTLKHVNIITVLGDYNGNETYFFIMEYMNNCDLLSYAKSQRNIAPRTSLQIVAGVLEGLNFIGEQGYIHRQLMASNILLGVHNICKLSGFSRAICVGKTKRFLDDQALPQNLLPWTAPEVEADNVYSRSSDVWSFGIVTHELIKNGTCPTKQEINKFLETKAKTFQSKNGNIQVKLLLKDLKRRCWQQKSSDRATTEDLLKVVRSSLANIDKCK